MGRAVGVGEARVQDELLERHAELGRVRELVDSAARGRGAAVLLDGPAGIGKTSLVAAARRLAADRDLRSLAARGGELERDFAYGVVRQLFEAPVAAAAPATRQSWLQGAAALSAPILGVAEPGAPGRPAGQHGNDPLFGDDPTAAALHGLYWLTVNIAAVTPLLLTVDDLHWVDAASLRYLAYLARRVAELPVLLITGSRPPVESHVPELIGALEADPAVIRLVPAPLSAAAVTELVRRDRGRLVADELGSPCHAATGGNPFLVRTLLSALAAGDPGIPVHPDRLPELGGGAVGRSVAQRLARLGQEAERLARAVAVLGTDVEPRHAYRLAGLADDAGAAAEHALIGADLLAPHRPLEFVHPIVRTAVAQLLSPPERATRHLEAARMLGTEGLEAERLVPYLLAGDARADPWVVDTLRRAAARSVQRGAPEAAVRYLQRALDEPPARDLRPTILAELGKAEVRAARPDDAVVHLREALAATEDPRTRALMTHDLAIGLIAPGRYAEAVAMLEQAAESARDVDQELSRRIQAELLCAAKLDARTLPIGRSLGERLPACVEASTPGGRMLLATVAHERMMRGGTAAEVAEMAARAVDGGLISEQSGDSGLVMDAGFALGAAGDFSRAGRVWSDALADVRRRGSVIGFARCSCMRAILRLHQGALGEAESDARNSIETAWEPGYRIARMAYGPLAESLVEQGELAAADGALSAAGFAAGIADTYMLNFVLFSRGRLRLAQGRHDEAIADLDELGRRERKWRGRNPAVFPYRSFLALALAASGEHDRAQALAAEEVGLARGWGAAGPLGRALRALALVTGGGGGLELLGQSRAVLDGSGWRLEHARTVIELGAATRRAGRRVEARDLLRPGMELAHACGARALVARAREELLATGARPRRIVRTGADALTASERRVARMAAEGMTNREIAQALFVTMRTVEVHLTHAYQKLGVSSREKLPVALGLAGS